MLWLWQDFLHSLFPIFLLIFCYGLLPSPSSLSLPPLPSPKLNKNRSGFGNNISKPVCSSCWTALLKRLYCDFSTLPKLKGPRKKRLLIWTLKEKKKKNQRCKEQKWNWGSDSCFCQETLKSESREAEMLGAGKKGNMNKMGHIFIYLISL